VECPKCGQGHLVARRARRTGTTFWGCSRYPKCDFTTSREPVGALHDADTGAVARNGEQGICLRCGAPIELPADVAPGQRLPGGEPNPAALAAPRRQGRSKAADNGRSGPAAGQAGPKRQARGSAQTRRRPPSAAA
jgi:hypothetical protein